MLQSEAASITILKYFLVFIILAIAVLAAWLGWQNRASEKVVLTVLPALAIGVTGALVTILFSLKSETRKVEFPSVFIFDKNSKMPLEALDQSYRYFSGRPGWGWHSSWYLIQELAKADPSFLGANALKGQELYLDILLRMVLEDLFRLYNNNWDVKVSRFDLPYSTESRWAPQEDAPEPEFVTWEDWKKWFLDTPVLDIDPRPSNKMAIPLGTKIAGSTELRNNKPFKRSLLVKNSFVELSISLEQSSGVIGMGDLRLLLGYSEEAGNQFWTSIYTVRLSAKFNPLRSGHPDMPRYHRWVDVMFEELQTEFDTRRHWEHARDRYMLFKDKMSSEG